jgi:hypothetical protein
MIGEGFRGYSEACVCISALKTAGIDAGITTGGIWVDLAEPTAEAEAIVKQHGGQLLPGGSTTTMEFAIQTYRIDRLKQ